MTTPSTQEVLQNVDDLLSDEGLTPDQADSGHKLEEHILPVLEKSRDIQSYLYSYEPPHARGFVRKLKNTFLTKMRNIIVNVMERATMRQQKYNELTYQAILELAQENRELKSEISQLKNGR